MLKKIIAATAFALVAALFSGCPSLAQQQAPLDGVVHMNWLGSWGACTGGVGNNAGSCFTAWSSANPFPVSIGSSVGGATPGVILSAASNNSTSIKGSAGTLYELTWLQTTTTLMDIRLYDTATAPTCSSATGVVANYVVQSNATSAGASPNLGSAGKSFVNGIGICITGANANNDNTNATTGLNVNYSFK